MFKDRYNNRDIDAIKQTIQQDCQFIADGFALGEEPDKNELLFVLKMINRQVSVLFREIEKGGSRDASL